MKNEIVKIIEKVQADHKSIDTILLFGSARQFSKYLKRHRKRTRKATQQKRLHYDYYFKNYFYQNPRKNRTINKPGKRKIAFYFHTHYVLQNALEMSLALNGAKTATMQYTAIFKYLLCLFLCIRAPKN